MGDIRVRVGLCFSGLRLQVTFQIRGSGFFSVLCLAQSCALLQKVSHSIFLNNASRSKHEATVLEFV